jgi:hypothetical protein
VRRAGNFRRKTRRGGPHQESAMASTSGSGAKKNVGALGVVSCTEAEKRKRGKGEGAPDVVLELGVWWPAPARERQRCTSRWGAQCRLLRRSGEEKRGKWGGGG